MIRTVLSTLVAGLLLVAGCTNDRVSPLAPTGAERLLSAELDLSAALDFATLPDLTQSRHAERYIRASEGGVVEIYGFRVEIPAGALPADTLVTIDLPTDATEAGKVLAEFGPHGIQFSKPVVITFPLEGVILPDGPIEVRRGEETGTWTSLGGSASADGKSFSSTTPHFSPYIMAGG